MIKRFLSFIKQIENSPKLIPKHLLNIVKKDTRSCTGNNLRTIKLFCDINKSSTITPSDIDKIEYAKISEDDKWKIKIVKELIELRYRQLAVNEFSDNELSDIMNYVCTS